MLRAHTGRKYLWAGMYELCEGRGPMIRKVLLAIWIVWALFWGSKVFAGEIEPNWDRLADAIRIAEGNSNYGILTHYKQTSYRQACINTCKHAWKDYSNEVLNVRPGASTAKLEYLQFLSKRYCPIGAKNDPHDLNKNWLKNVSYYYNKGEL